MDAQRSRRRVAVALAAASIWLGGSPMAQLPLQAGNVVATYCPDPTGLNGSPDPAGNVVIHVDVIPLGPLGDNWLAPIFSNEGAPPAEVWNYGNLGSVFGIALDNHSDIYVTATRVYGDFGPLTFGPGGGGAVYRLDGVTGNIDQWITLPNPSQPGETPPGLGDICYDSKYNQFFVSNFADGKIYRIKDVAGLGSVVEAHDPFDQYPYPQNPTFAPLGERVWAVHIATVPIFGNRLTSGMKRVLLFSVWLRDYNSTNTPWPASWPLVLFSQVNNAIFSWELDSQGDLVSGGPRLYCVMPYLKDGVSFGYSNPVSDITSLGASVFFAERGGAHQARVLRLNAFPKKIGVVFGRPPGGFAWQDPFDYSYRVGDFVNPRGWNCTGGVAVCRPLQLVAGPPSIWTTGDYLKSLIYGLQWIPGGGNQNCTPHSSCTFLIDLTHDTDLDKTQPGDVECIWNNAQ